ncbi:MAG TPA: hypothetical protein VMB50_04145 [Myxococcales bacterium]|nr:hypothetical protein [Myxococcales bacterium]
MVRRGLSLAAVALAACAPTAYAPGALLCDAAGSCPDGMACRCDGACWPAGQAPPTCAAGGTTGSLASTGGGSSGSGASSGGTAAGASGSAASSGGTTAGASGSAASSGGTTAGPSGSGTGGGAAGSSTSGTTGSAASTGGTGGATTGGPPDAGPTELTLLAGQLGGAGDADGMGGVARLNRPGGLALDQDGGLYVLDTGTARLRRIATGSGLVTTVATGLGSDFAITLDGPFAFALGYQGVDKVALATSIVSQEVSLAPLPISFQAGLAVDGMGSLYVPALCEILAIDVATGQMTTLAGSQSCSGQDGVGPDAGFEMLAGLAYDGAGSLYAADGCAMRRIVLATAAVTTLLGGPGACGDMNGSAGTGSLNSAALAYDGRGTLYFTQLASTSNGQPQIRGLSLAPTPSVFTLPAAAPPYSNPGGIAIDSSQTLYVADTGNDVVRAYSLTSGQSQVLAGAFPHPSNADGVGPDAGFDDPQGLAYDSQTGTLYVADAANGSLRAIAVAAETVTTLATNLQMPSALAKGSTHVYVSDTGTCTLYQVGLAGGHKMSPLAGTGSCGSPVDGAGPAAVFSSPTSLASDQIGDLYVADRGVLRLVTIGDAGATVTTLDAGVDAVAYGGASLYAVEGTRVVQIDPATLKQTTYANGFVAPYALAADGQGDVYVADQGDATVRLIAGPGNVSLLAGVPNVQGVLLGPLPGRLNVPSGLALGPAGTLFISDQAEDAILELQ